MEKLCNRRGDNYYLGREYSHGVFPFYFVSSLLITGRETELVDKTKLWSQAIMDPRWLNLKKVGLVGESQVYGKADCWTSIRQNCVNLEEERIESASFQFPWISWWVKIIFTSLNFDSNWVMNYSFVRIFLISIERTGVFNTACLICLPLRQRSYIAVSYLSSWIFVCLFFILLGRKKAGNGVSSSDPGSQLNTWANSYHYKT